MPTLATLLIALAAAGAPQPPSAEHDFHFVVLGDSQFHDPPAFNRLIDDAARLRPAFVVQVGDMISGYTDNVVRVRREWRRFKRQIAPLSPIPFIAVPGNHDLYGSDKQANAAVTAMYTDNWGPTYHSFVYQNARFIVLNSDAVGEEKRIGDQQLRWLKDTLNNNESKHVFAFLHRPAGNLDNAAELHELFARHGVGYVFYGHHHHFHYREQDGVRYIMTNAAADSALPFQEAGSFHHLLQVSVHDDEVRVAAIRADAIVAEDSVAPEDNYDLFALHRAMVPKSIEAQASGQRQWTATLPLRNTAKRPLTLFVECASEDRRLRVSPAQIPPIALSAGGKQSIRMTWSHAPNQPPEGSVSCSVLAPFQTHDGQWLHHRANVPIQGITD